MGRKLFWKYGLRRVSVDEICRESGVSKMTFYRCYSNKTELAKSIYIKVIEEGVTRFKEILQAESSPAEKLKQILLLKIEGTHEISREFLADFYRSDDPELREFIEEATIRTWTGITELFREAQEKGIFRKDFKPGFLLMLTQYLIPVMTDEKLLAMYDTPQDLIIELANFFTWGIAPHE